MNTSVFLSNLAVYSLQIGVLVTLAAAAPAVLRMRAPGARLAFWHILLMACIVLPLIRPWRQEVVTAPAMATFTTPFTTAYTPAAPIHRGFPWSEAAVWALGAGISARLLWLVIGLWRLRRYRLHSEPFDTAYDADIRMSPDVSSPVTFGLFNPVILVPPHFADLDAPMQQAILCHEILHIERRDWLFTMAEELVRAVFWFHPAVWWVLGQIHLTREQAVDRRVIEATEARGPYVDALLAMAGVRPQLDLAPAPLFLRKRHLKHRVVGIFQEAHMSRKTLISALAAGVAMLAAACWLVTGALPLAAAPQVVADAPGVAVNLNGAQLMHRSSIMYPSNAIEKEIQGTVVVQVKLDPNGEVTDATVQSGPDELRKAVLQSVLNWHFMKDSTGTTRTVTVEFTAPPHPALEQYARMARPTVITSANAGSATRVLRDIEVSGMSDEAKNDLLAQLPVHIGDNVGPEQFMPVIEAARKFDSHLSAVFIPNRSGDYSLRITAPGASVAEMRTAVAGGVQGGVVGGIAGSFPPPPPAPQSAGGTPGRIMVGGDAQATKLISQTRPEYPALAKQARISGVVELSAIISKDGHVANLSVVKGHPLLVQAALEAVKDWIYQPTLLNGQPVEVTTTIDVNFTLAE